TERILDNILHNAVKYSPQNGWVKLHASREDNFLILYCDDSGPGVSVEVRERIFTPYVTDQADTDAYGLGLSFVNAAMQAIGGRIEAPTPPVGTGGRFALYFPAVTTTETRPTSLSEVDHLMLASYISQLRETPFYAATELEVLLDQIPETGSLPDWKRAVRKAMYAGDRAGFEALLK
ncbi:MAG: ATP-binding protein, partial [Bacteroidota bacterium]